MEITETKLRGCIVIKPRIFTDERGYFFESFNEKQFQERIGIDMKFVQDNQSQSKYGVVRGLHGQTGKYEQAKLVRVLEGEILDVAVDIRPDSETFGQHYVIKLSAENKLQLFIPEGFLHGFSVLSPKATVFYKCNNYYKQEAEIGVIYNDPDLNIDWLIAEEDRILSSKDRILPFLKNL